MPMPKPKAPVLYRFRSRPGGFLRTLNPRPHDLDADHTTAEAVPADTSAASTAASAVAADTSAASATANAAAALPKPTSGPPLVDFLEQEKPFCWDEAFGIERVEETPATEAKPTAGPPLVDFLAGHAEAAPAPASDEDEPDQRASDDELSVPDPPPAPPSDEDESDQRATDDDVPETDYYAEAEDHVPEPDSGTGGLDTRTLKQELDREDTPVADAGDDYVEPEIKNLELKMTLGDELAELAKAALKELDNEVQNADADMPTFFKLTQIANDAGDALEELYGLDELQEPEQPPADELQEPEQPPAPRYVTGFLGERYNLDDYEQVDVDGGTESHGEEATTGGGHHRSRGRGTKRHSARNAARGRRSCKMKPHAPAGPPPAHLLQAATAANASSSASFGTTPAVIGAAPLDQRPGKRVYEEESSSSESCTKWWTRMTPQAKARMRKHLERQ